MATLPEIWSSKVPLVLDGGMGTELMARVEGRWSSAGEMPASGELEAFNRDRPDVVRAVHAAYVDAGARALSTNTFGALDVLAKGSSRGARDEHRALLQAGVRLAREAADGASSQVFVLGSIGPGRRTLGQGTIDAATLARDLELAVAALLAAGVDGLLFETVVERAALDVALEVAERSGASSIVVALTVTADGSLPDGTRVHDLAPMLPAAVDVIALNCTSGLTAASHCLAELRAASSRPLGWWPNAGRPERVGDRFVWPVDEREFSAAVADATRRHGLALVGGCCGTSPRYVRSLVDALEGAAS